MKKIIIFISILLIACSCTKETLLMPTFSKSICFISSRGTGADIDSIRNDANGFGIFAYNTPNNWEKDCDQAKPNIMNRVKVTYSSNNWVTNSNVLWPDSGKVSFFAYYPYSLFKANIDEAGLPYFSYTSDNDINKHTDLLADCKIDKGSESNPIELSFHHILSKIRIEAKTYKEYQAKMYITKATLNYKKNSVIKKATFKYTSDESEVGKWEIDRSKENNFFSGSTELLKQNEKIELNSENSISLTGNKSIYIIPQDISKDSLSISVNYKYDDKDFSRTISLTQSDTKFEANYQYIYSILVKDGSIYIDSVRVEEYSDVEKFKITYKNRIASGNGNDKFQTVQIQNVYNNMSTNLSIGSGIMSNDANKRNFIGWTMNPNSEDIDYKPGALITPTSNMTLYAVFNDGTIDYTKRESSNCYIINPAKWSQRVYYIPIEDRIKDYWNNYAKTGVTLNNDNWDIIPLWYDCAINPLIPSNSVIDRITIEKVSASEGKSQQAFKVIIPPEYTNWGNIIVAVATNIGTDQEKILWSWHLWLTDYDPDSKECVAGACGAYKVLGGEIHRYDGEIWSNGIYKDKFIMDRNIGAISTNNTGTSIGTLYFQYGRKDPFPAYEGKRMNGKNFEPVKEKNTNSTMNKSVNNPTTIYYGDGNWLTNIPENSIYYTDNCIWNDYQIIQGTEQIKTKSIFDPSPLGWELPDISIWEDFNTTNFIYSNSMRTYKSFAKYPSFGCRNYETGKVVFNGYNNGNRSRNFYNTDKAYYLGFGNGSDIRNTYLYPKSHMVTARAIKQ